MGNCNYKLMDFEICEDISLLKKMKLVIWGAADKGVQIKRTLEEILHINVELFVDSDIHKQYTQVDNLSVYPPDIIMEAEETNAGFNICVISCVANDIEIVRQMEMLKTKKVFLISYWGIKTAFIMNEYHLCSYNDLYKYDEMWKYRLSNNCRNLTIEYFLNKYKNSNSDTIWILQAGKAASTTMEERLKAVSIPYLKEHTLHYPNHIMSGELKIEWENIVSQKIKNKLKIICAVREPLARDYSAFWQAFSYPYETAYAVSIRNKKIQVMYDQYIELIRKGYDYSIRILKDRQPFVWRDQFRWFNEEIKEYFGIDIYEYPFDKEKGYEIIEEKNISIFLFKVERMEESIPFLCQFIGCESLPKVDGNKAEQKAYYLPYQDFRKKIRLSQNYIDHYYKANPYMDHFYSESEKKDFLEKWRENIWKE